VLINEAGQPACTGTLIAPNLVLTARHCVSYYNENNDCLAPLSGEIGPSLLTISTGVYASPQQWVARGTKFYVAPATPQGVCGADVALVLLDKDVPNAKIATVRFAAPTVNEMTTAVGYGEGGGRKQRPDVKVLALGPTTASYTTGGGQKLTMNLPANDLATTESTCYGDSGGGLFDSLGQVMAVGSRGLDAQCSDRPTYWTSLQAYEQLIRDAASAAGHPLPRATVPQARDKQANGASSGTTEDPVGDDDDDEDDTTPGSSGKPKRGPSVVSAGCGVASIPVSTTVPWLELGLALAVTAFRRRRAR
jgi:secreted trypsin-like serine protease